MQRRRRLFSIPTLKTYGRKFQTLGKLTFLGNDDQELQEVLQCLAGHQVGQVEEMELYQQLVIDSETVISKEYKRLKSRDSSRIGIQVPNLENEIFGEAKHFVKLKFANDNTQHMYVVYAQYSTTRSPPQPMTRWTYGSRRSRVVLP